MQDLSLYNNKSFDPGAGVFVRALWYCVNALFFDSWLMPLSKVKIIILRAFGANIGNNVVIKPKVNIKYPWNLKIGDNVWIGERVWIDNLTLVDIGNNVCISQGVYLLTGNHNFKKRSFDLMVRTIVIKDCVWLGAKSIITPGVVVNENVVVTVGQIVTKDISQNTIFVTSKEDCSRVRSVVD